jgi:hypothetical protein
MTTQSTDLFQTIADITNPHKPKKTRLINSIQLPKSLSVIDEFGNRRRVFFITEGQRVKVNEVGELLDLNDETPTHQITSCWSSLFENLGVTVIDLKTRELRKIEL